VVRLKLAMKRGTLRTIDVERAEDHRDHLLVYLFAVLLPLFDANIGRARDSAATILAFVFVVFLFWHLNLHYMNVFFAIAGYRVFTIHGPATRNRLFSSPKGVPWTPAGKYTLTDSPIRS